jgi:hypothetical protein
MSAELREQIRAQLGLRATEDLLEIWQENDRRAWSDAAFDIMGEILRERLGEVPPQGKPKTEADEDLEVWEKELLDSEDQPELYNVVDVITLKRTIDKAVIAFVVAWILLVVANMPWIWSLAASGVPTLREIRGSVPGIITYGLAALVEIVMTCVPLKALAHILRILMQMEFNSRKPDKLAG